MAIGIYLFITFGNANHPGVSTSTPAPVSTLNAFCSALKNQDDQTAYSLFSSHQSQFSSEANFASDMDILNKLHGGLTDCTVLDYELHENDTTGIANDTFQADYADGTTLWFNAILSNENGSWELTNITFS